MFIGSVFWAQSEQRRERDFQFRGRRNLENLYRGGHDILRDPNLLIGEWFKEKGLNSFIGQPLINGGKLVGVITAFSRIPESFGQKDIEYLEVLASQTVIAIENAEHFGKSVSRGKRLEIMARISKAVGSELKPEELFNIIVQQIQKYVPCERVGISRVDQKTRKLYFVNYKSNLNDERHKNVQTVSDEFFQTIYKEMKIRKVPDIRELRIESYQRHAEVGLRTHLVVPIPNEDECIAHISLFSVEVGAFTKNDEELLTAIAAHLGPALQNARLYEESERKGKRLATLIKATKHLTEDLDLPFVLNSIVEAAAVLFEGEAGLRLLDGDELVRVAVTERAGEVMIRERVPVDKSFSAYFYRYYCCNSWWHYFCIKEKRKYTRNSCSTCFENKEFLAALP